MGKIFKKQNVMPVVVLGIICIVVALILGAVNMITAPIIEDAKNAAANEALLVVLPGAKNFEEIEVTSDFPAEVKKAHKADIGYVFEVDVKGKEAMTVMCGVGNDGKIVNVKVLSEQETPGYKEKVFPNVTGENGKYNGKDASSLEPEIFSGATLTSNGVYNAIKASLNAFAVIGGGEIIVDEDPALKFIKSEEELISLGKELVGENAEFTDVTPEKTTVVRKVYKENGGNGYLVYTLSISEDYGTVDTENLIHIGNDGVVINIKKLTWKVSDAAPDWGYNPPSEEKMDELYGSIVGKNESTLDDLDLKTGATNTTTKLVDSIKEAVSAVKTLVNNEFLSDEEILSIAKEFVEDENAVFTDVTPNTVSAVKKIYKNDLNGYIVYLVTTSSQHNCIDTESVVHIGFDGIIKNIKKLTWTVGAAAPDKGYNPPSDSEVDSFYAGLKGETIDTIGEVDIQTGATFTTKVLVDSVTEALKAVNKIIREDVPTSAKDVKAIAAEMAGKELSLVSFNLMKNIPYALKTVYSAGADGYFLYVVVPKTGEYVSVASEALIQLNEKCEIINVKLLSFDPENGTDPGDFANRFVGKNKDTIASVALLDGAAEVSENFRTALKAAVATVDRGTTDFEALLKLRMESIVPSADGFEKLPLPENAAKTLKALYKVKGFDGYVAYVITSTQYVEVETEALVYVNAKGEVGDVYLVTWAVGHGVSAGEFPERLIGLNSKSLKDVELVSSATVTSEHLRDAVIDALNVIPVNRTPFIVAIIAAVLSVGSFVAYIVVIKSSRRRKN